MGKPISRSSGSLGTLSIGGKAIANVTDIRIEPMGFLPPPPPARRSITVVNQGAAIPAYGVVAVAQSTNQTARNIWAAQAALEAAQQMRPSPVESKKAAEPPKIDKPRKRKVTLE